MKENNDVILLAVGDIMLGELAICIGYGVNSVIKENGPNFIFEKIRDVLNDKDILFGNLEAVLSEKNLRMTSLKSRQLRGDPDSVRGLKYAGFDVLSLANNHVLEHGKEALLDTIYTLEKNNINYVGVEKYDRKPIVMEVKGKKISFLAYCLIEEPTAFNSVKTIDEILDDIRKYKDWGDINIVSLHWGTEFMPYPSQHQIELAHKIIDAGADIILGHHPHVVKGIEYYRQKVIAYSLGNFVFDMQEGTSRESIILKITISADNAIKVNLLPVFIDSSYRPIPGDLEKGKDYFMSNKLSQIGEMIKEDYGKKVRSVHKNIGRERRHYFLKNLYRYPPNLATQYLLRSIKLRIKNK